MSRRLHLDRTRCTGRGSCLELLPELLRPDDWGHPIGPDRHGDVAVPPSLERDAREAVRGCPRLALRLTG